MSFLKHPGIFQNRNILIPAGIIFSGLCWFLGNGLSGNYWYLYWLAPIPVFLMCYHLRMWPSFFVAFIAYLIGRLSWFSYLSSVLPFALVIVFTLLFPLIFAMVAVAARKIVLRSSHWSVTLAFPALWTSFEYLMLMFSRDGTAGSIAYTQFNFLPFIQLASVTGIQGITFLLCFLPSAISVAIFYRQDKKNTKRLLLLTASVFVIVIVAGAIRLGNNSIEKNIHVGLITIDEKEYGKIYEPDPQKQVHIAEQYLKEIMSLTPENVQVIVLPEKAIIVNDSTFPVIRDLFMHAARSRNVTIVAGVTKIKKDRYENNAWVIDREGKLIVDYQKVNLFEGEAAEGFMPGNTIAVFESAGEKTGVAICKDLDFQQFMHQYGKEKIGLLFVPAWDFVADGWLHSRMAMMRSVEGGYAMVRNAREGRLTTNDYRGKVLNETSSENKKTTVLLAEVPVLPHPTIYSKTGDWFSLLNIIAACYFLFLVFRKKSPVSHQ